ncbi:hypothetical protein, partial [Chryseobacterium sp. SIMBA_028]|uniref:hypothetical protein n=1 Tax=Chryseobacterium sp. SIMBA_028 TaxID=3085771 RepID=UPI00397C7A11
PIFDIVESLDFSVGVRDTQLCWAFTHLLLPSDLFARASALKIKTLKDSKVAFQAIRGAQPNADG